jgi:hypothetical protein
MKKKLFWGLIGLTLVFSAVFLSCGDAGGDDKETTYTVEVRPPTISLVPGASQTFSAVLRKDGQELTSGTRRYAWTSTPTGGQSTELGTGQTQSVTVPSGTTAAITVEVRITYSGTPYTGTATITIMSDEAAAAAFTAITGALSETAFLAALEAAPGVSPQYFTTTESKAAVWEAKDAIIAICATATEANVATLGPAINGIIMQKVMELALDFFNTQNATAIKGYLTQANFELFQLGELWPRYEDLSDAGKTAVAAALIANQPYEGLGEVIEAIAEAVWERAIEEMIPKAKPALDAAISPNATLAQINAFLVAATQFGAPEAITATAGNLSAIKAVIAKDEGLDDGTPIHPIAEYKAANENDPDYGYKFARAAEYVFQWIYQTEMYAALKPHLDKVIEPNATVADFNALITVLTDDFSMGWDDDEIPSVTAENLAGIKAVIAADEGLGFDEDDGGVIAAYKADRTNQEKIEGAITYVMMVLFFVGGSGSF